jgi:hypothetical protein
LVDSPIPQLNIAPARDFNHPDLEIVVPLRVHVESDASSSKRMVLWSKNITNEHVEEIINWTETEEEIF